MLFHLPISILVAFSPIAVSDAVPNLDIVRECRFEGGSTVEFDRCSQDEGAALRDLQQDWAQFAGADKRNCVAATTIGGVASYVELLTCLEMARDVVSANPNPNDPRLKSGSRPRQAGRPGVTVGEAHQH